MSSRKVRKHKHRAMNKKNGKKPMSNEQKEQNKKKREEHKANNLAKLKK